MNILSYAERYIKLGFSVIPLKEKSKEPLIKWEEFQRRLATPEELKAWFSKPVNIGVITGPLSKLAVIDADGERGISSLQQLSVSSPVAVLSGSGRHLWFQWAEGLRNSASKLAENVDVRGDGGYVVAPPSLHPNGALYRFQNPLSPLGFLPEFPATCLKPLLTVPKRLEATPTKQDNVLAEALEAMKNGHVHNTLVSVLGKFRAFNFDRESTYKLLAPYALVDGKPFDGLKDKIDEIWGRYEPKYFASATAPTSEPKSIESFLEKEITTEWFCKPFFSRQSLAFIVGLPESLKSWLAIDLAIEIARGGRWLGAYETKKSRVLYIDQERSLSETQRRFKGLLSDKGLSKRTLSDSLYVDCSSHRKMDLDSSFESFRREVAEIKPDVIIVDSFVTFHTKPENDRMEIQKVLDRLKQLREEFNCSTIFINHESKNAYQDANDHNEPSAGRMVGSIGVVAAAESILTVKKIDKESINVYQTKNSLAAPAESFTVKINDTASGIRLESIK